jgi:hypothetical protein
LRLIHLVAWGIAVAALSRSQNAWPLLSKFHPVSASSPPSWLNLNLCVVARFPNAPSNAVRLAALALMIPRLATVPITA